jgi:putative endonuclease
MVYYVYMLKCINEKINKTYVGYTNNLNLRLNRHNSGKGAKSTRGFKWKIIYKKKFNLKCEAMSYEYKLKKDRLKRTILLNNSND